MIKYTAQSEHSKSDDGKPSTANNARAPLTLLDLLLVVIAFGFSAGMVVRALAGQKDLLPPLHWVPVAPVDWDQQHLLFGFAGVLGLGPIVQGLQLLRFGRRNWTTPEWTWSALGVVYAIFPFLHFALCACKTLLSYVLPETSLDWLGFGLYIVFYGGPGVVASAHGVIRLSGIKTLPWSGWLGMGVSITWSGVWAWFVVPDVLWLLF